MLLMLREVRRATDPLAFRPNPDNLTLDRHGSDESSSEADEADAGVSSAPKSGLYRPPRTVAMPYSEAPPKGPSSPPLPHFTSPLRSPPAPLTHII